MIKQWMLLLAVLTASQFAYGQRAVIDKVIAMVGGEVVLLSELEEQYSQLKAQSPGVPETARCEIIDQIMVAKLLVNQARLDSVIVAEAELEEQLNARIDRILTYMNGDLEQFEAFYGQTVTQVKEQFRDDLESQLLAERIRGQVLAGVSVTPSEVKQFFRQIPQDSLPYFSSEVEVGEIVYTPPVNDEERQKSIDKLTEIREQIVTGSTTFEAMAQKFSDDGSARIGGDLGWAKRGKFVPEFEAAAYQLEINDISPVIETEFGFHIIQLLDRRGNTIHVRHILVRSEITDADLVKARRHLDSVRMLVVNDSISFSAAVKRYGNEEVQSYTNDGRMLNPATGNTFYEVADLDPDVYFAVDTLEIGGTTAAFSFKGPTNETFYRIVQLQSRTVPHRANLQQDYNKIQEATKQSKQNEHLSSWIEEKLAATYLYVDDRYNTCANLDKWRNESAASKSR